VVIAGHRFGLEPGESIHTENSYKYSADGFRALAAQAGFIVNKTWTDRRELFALHALQSA
jgi:L-histidine Nalpha-methyltransferase